MPWSDARRSVSTASGPWSEAPRRRPRRAEGRRLRRRSQLGSGSHAFRHPRSGCAHGRVHVMAHPPQPLLDSRQLLCFSPRPGRLGRRASARASASSRACSSASARARAASASARPPPRRLLLGFEPSPLLGFGPRPGRLGLGPARPAPRPRPAPVPRPRAAPAPRPRAAPAPRPRAAPAPRPRAAPAPRPRPAPAPRPRAAPAPRLRPAPAPRPRAAPAPRLRPAPAPRLRPAPAPRPRARACSSASARACSSASTPGPFLGLCSCPRRFCLGECHGFGQRSALRPRACACSSACARASASATASASACSSGESMRTVSSIRSNAAPMRALAASSESCAFSSASVSALTSASGRNLSQRYSKSSISSSESSSSSSASGLEFFVLVLVRHELVPGKVGFVQLRIRRVRVMRARTSTPSPSRRLEPVPGPARCRRSPGCRRARCSWPERLNRGDRVQCSWTRRGRHRASRTASGGWVDRPAGCWVHVHSIGREPRGIEPSSRAEEVGFEPTVGCPTHDFQSCRFGRSRTPPRLQPGQANGRDTPG